MAYIYHVSPQRYFSREKKQYYHAFKNVCTCKNRIEGGAAEVGALILWVCLYGRVIGSTLLLCKHNWINLSRA